MSKAYHIKDKLLSPDTLFINHENEKIWAKYCGFMDLSIEEFMTIQRFLLKEQLELMSESVLGRKIMDNHDIQTEEEFRKKVPITTYKDYETFFETQNDEVLNQKPAIWAHTSGRMGLIKWAPYTTEMVARLADDTLAAFILSSASQKGDVRVQEGSRVVLNLPPLPYTTGIMGFAVAQRISYNAIPPLTQAAEMTFEERIKEGYKEALYKGVDYAASIAVVLNKVGDTFSNLSKSGQKMPIYHPLALLRILRAIAISKFHKRSLLPKDIWKVKGLVCGGTDTVIYRDQIFKSWGVQPLDAYVATEACFIAMQNWNKKGMTFTPFSNFYEFIPEEEMEKNRRKPDYQPRTILLDEVQAGHEYELVITNFLGGSLLRYRLGDVIKIISLSDEETGGKLPQMVFQRRTDDIIDISGFVRLDEKLLWQAIQETGLAYVDWVAVKQNVNNIPTVRIYIELHGNSVEPEQIAAKIDTNLTAIFTDYRDLRQMIGTNPISVILLKHGTFSNYQQNKQNAGFDIAHLKPPHINQTDSVLKDLLDY
jgi:hypothetical protein